MQKEDVVNLEKLILREEDKVDGEVIDIESDNEDKGEDDDIEILGARLQEPKQARIKWI